MEWKCMPSSRSSSRSRIGPSEMQPVTPRTFMALAMLPPTRPTLAAYSSGKSCLMMRHDGRLFARLTSSCWSTSIQETRLKPSRGGPQMQVTA